MTSLFRGKAEVITESLREMILTGEMAPGAVLRQRSLAARFSVSPTPVREALRQLEAEGLVVTELHRGATVVRPAEENKEELYELRAAIESIAARTAAERINDAQIEALQAIHDQISALPADSDEITALNRRFHMGIYEAPGPTTALALIRLSWNLSHGGPQVVWRPHEESVAEHGRMLQALRRRDGQELAELTRVHILGSLGYMRRALDHAESDSQA